MTTRSLKKPMLMSMNYWMLMNHLLQLFISLRHILNLDRILPLTQTNEEIPANNTQLINSKMLISSGLRELSKV